MAGSQRIARRRARAAQAQVAHAAVAKRAVGYVRVSTEEQASKGTGLDVQERAIRAFAASQGYELVDVFADPGVSGASLPAKRDGFGRLLERTGAGGIALLLVWKFDRLARHQRHAINTVHVELIARNIDLRSVTEAAIDTGSSMGRLLFSILAGGPGRSPAPSRGAPRRSDTAAKRRASSSWSRPRPRSCARSSPCGPTA